MADELATIYVRALDLSQNADIQLTPAEGCELRALQADVAWELSLSGSPLAMGESEEPSESSAELAQRAFGWLKTNAGDECGKPLGSAKHATMRLELADLCDKALQKMGSGTEGSGEGGGEEALEASRDELGGVAFEQVPKPPPYLRAHLPAHEATPLPTLYRCCWLWPMALLRLGTVSPPFSLSAAPPLSAGHRHLPSSSARRRGTQMRSASHDPDRAHLASPCSPALTRSIRSLSAG